MNIKSFKINDLNIMTKVLLTKSEAIGLCKISNWRARRVFMKNLTVTLSSLKDVEEGVKAKASIMDKLIRKFK